MEAEAQRFSICLFTPESPAADEARKIEALLASPSVGRVHLRHPALTDGEMETILSAISPGLRPRVTLHSCFAAACGDASVSPSIHLNGRCPVPPQGYEGRYSRSFHSLGELMACRDARISYATLSPVYDSISKAGYEGRDFSLPESTLFPVIALGGVTPARIPDLKGRGFHGAAMLGAVPWGGDPDDIKRFLTDIEKYLRLC